MSGCACHTVSDEFLKEIQPNRILSLLIGARLDPARPKSDALILVFDPMEIPLGSRSVVAILSQTYDPRLCKGLNDRIEAALRLLPERTDAPRWTLEVSFAGLCVVRER